VASPDQELAALERQARAAPEDPAPAERLAALCRRLGRRADAARWALAVGAAAGADFARAYAALRTAEVPLAPLPAVDGTALVAAGPDGPVVVGRLPFPGGARPHLAGDLAVGLGLDGAALQAVELRQGLGLAPGWPLPLPGRLRGHCAATRGGVVYVGGSGERLLTADLGRPGEGWVEARLPEEAGRAGKAIDALLFDGARLLAVDDILLPKWVFVLDLTDPRRPACVDRRSLLAHYTYERVRCAALGPRHLVTLSHGGGRAGPRAFLTAYAREDLAETGVAALRSGDGLLGGPGPAAGLAPQWHDVAFAGETLVVAAGTRGAVALDPEELPAEAGAALPPVRTVGPVLGPGEEAVRVVPAPGRDAAVLVAIAGWSEAALARAPWNRGGPERYRYAAAEVGAPR